MPFLAETHYPIETCDILSWCFDKPRFDQDRPVYIDASDTSKFWTASQARTAIRQLAAGFTALGLKRGDCVCIHSFNDLNYPILVNGIVGFGGVYTGSNPGYTAYELVHHLKASEAKAAVVEPALLETLSKAAAEIGLPRERILMFDTQGEKDLKGFRSWRTLFEHGEMDWPRFRDLETAKNTIASLGFSSGTTGLPKPVMLSHHNMIAQHALFWEYKGTTWQKRRLVALPMFHVATSPLCHFSPLHSGDIMYIMRRAEFEPYIANFEKFQITEGAFVPPMVHMIISSPLTSGPKPKYSLKSLRNAHTGAAPLDAGSQARLKELLREDTPVTQVWGMTETSCTCSCFSFEEGHETTGSVGRMLPNMDSKLVDDDGTDITANDTRGELCVRGPLVVNGYYRNPEANTRDWDDDGFFHTGDIAYRDGKSKKWYIVGRKKELIKVRAFQVAPVELEGALLTHPDIVDAAVIGVPAPEAKDGELPRAYVVAKPGANSRLSEKGIREFMKERLARYKQLDGGVVLADSIPKTASGKILKRVLAEQAKREMEGSVRARM